LEHGEWQPWLAENFDLSYDTALNYYRAAEYVERKTKSRTVRLFNFENLAPTVLYRLAAGRYDEREEAAILAEAKAGERVDQARAWDICEELAPPEPDDDGEDAEGGGEDAAENPEAAAILDGPPPAPPPAPNAAPPDFALRAFDNAINALKPLVTKLLAQFAGTTHSADDLEKIESFIGAVAKARRKAPAPATEPTGEQ
jgi:hypothetical protein